MQLNTRIKHKRDTAARWAANNPILLDGELIIVETTDGYTRLKIGDGTSTYGQLPFTDETINEQIAGLSSSVTALDNSKVTGPARAVSNNVAIFDGTTGKLVKDSGLTLSVSVPADAKFTDTTYETGTTTVSGLTKLYTSTGTATDGAMTQSAVKSALDAKAPLASPAFTGTPIAPTAAAGTNTTQVATTAFVSSAIANLVDSAPETLNTLGELATALQENEEVTDALNEAIGTKANDSEVVKLTGNQTIDGTKTFSSTISGSVSGSATKLAEEKSITLSGDITGTVNFDGSKDVTISTSIANGLQVALGELTIDDIVVMK